VKVTFSRREGKVTLDGITLMYTKANGVYMVDASNNVYVAYFWDDSNSWTYDGLEFEGWEIHA
jgi:hypothetical protein